MITPGHHCMSFTRALTSAFALSFGYTMVAAPMVRSEGVYSDTLIVVSSDIQLRVIEAGPLGAQSIVFIPGWCFTANIWKKQISAFSDHYHVVAFDPRSQGGSTIVEQSNSPENRAEDLASLIKKLHLRKPVIVGWSQGVQDVAAFVLKFGTSEVSGLVLVDALVSAGAANLDAKSASMTLNRMPIYVNSPRDYLEAMMHYIFRKDLSPNEGNTIVTSALQTPSSIGVANLVLDLFGKDYRQAYKLIDVPTLLIVAGTAPDKSEQMQQPILNATKAVVDSAGHAVFYDDPEKFNDVLERFLKEKVEDKTAR